MAKRTTVVFEEENLIKEAKKKAVEEDKTLKEIVNEALRTYLQVRKPTRKKFPFKGYHMGEIKGTLRREEIYEDV